MWEFGEIGNVYRLKIFRLYYLKQCRDKVIQCPGQRCQTVASVFTLRSMFEDFPTDQSWKTVQMSSLQYLHTNLYLFILIFISKHSKQEWVQGCSERSPLPTFLSFPSRKLSKKTANHRWRRHSQARSHIYIHCMPQPPMTGFFTLTASWQDTVTQSASEFKPTWAHS